MPKKILAFAFAIALLAGTVTPALAGSAATVTTSTGDPTDGGSLVPPSGIATIDVEADHADGTEDVADRTVP